MTNFFLGCDVSKGYADFVIINEQKVVIEPNFQLDDTFTGHQKLFHVLEQFFEKFTDTQLFAAVESTGGYENNWLQTLKSFSRVIPIKTARINPIGIKHHTKAAMKRVTNDRISANSIAEYQIHHPEKLQYNQDDEYQTLKRLVTATRMFVKAKVQFINELESLLYTANPELITYRKNKISNWMFKLLLQYPDAESLAKASVKNIEKIAFISPNRAQQLVSSAQTSVASATDEMTRVAIVSLVESILDLEAKTKQNIKIMEQHTSLPQVLLLRSFNAIGTLSAVELLIEIGCIERFPSVKHLASYCGIHPVYKESGDGVRGIRMSKQGRRKARATLYMIALCAIRCNPIIKEVYQRELQKGKAKRAALGVCMHKILRIVYGMLKNNTLFNPEIDKKNQLNQFSRKTTDKSDNKRRYQKQDQNAPISRKQSIKRKEKELSQSDNITVCEIIDPSPSIV